MIELSSLLLKPVIERDTSKIVGRIKNAYFSQACNSIAYFVMSSCRQGCDALLPVSDVLCYCDAIVVQNDANVRCIGDVDFTLFSSGIIGMDVYTQNGILKGSIEKVEFTKSGKVTRLFTQNEQFAPQNIACIGDVMLLKTAKQGKSAKPHIPRPENETTVFALKPQHSHPESEESSAQTQISNEYAEQTASAIQNSQFKAVQITATPLASKIATDSPYFSSNALKIIGAPQNANDVHTPSRIITDYTFLLGRTLSNDLTTFSGTLIAESGTVIDDSLVEKSRRSGKLIDLIFLAKSSD